MYQIQQWSEVEQTIGYYVEMEPLRMTGTVEGGWSAVRHLGHLVFHQVLTKDKAFST